MEKYADLIHLDWTLLMVAVNFLILYVILKLFFFKKVHQFMLDRQNAVKDAFDQADRTNLIADEQLAEYKKQLANIENEGREIIKNAKIRAEAQAKEIVDDASRKASEMILQAHRDIERDRLKAVVEMKQQIGGLAIYAAEKIIEKQLDAAGQEDIIQRVIEQAGNSGWQN
ncbi:F0F1 ATP synthase subunit B [Anoxybacterium hadale]|uniref:F0F1 ATP synthase subunit B n=1 Tax=Anoxybacterium hadale TaxID=3408580 RepID=A0ACD1AE83_9FIRM|nr:F0F1 ATP synthase subunit B [Clostridiales bacterium]